jgi:hypothetical protein
MNRVTRSCGFEMRRLLRVACFREDKLAGGRLNRGRQLMVRVQIGHPRELGQQEQAENKPGLCSGSEGMGGASGHGKLHRGQLLLITDSQVRVNRGPEVVAQFDRIAPSTSPQPLS